MDDYEPTYAEYAMQVSCFDVGMNDGCGITCPVFCRGDCDIANEMTDDCDHPTDLLNSLTNEFGLDKATTIMYHYSVFEDFIDNHVVFENQIAVRVIE